MTTGGWNTAVIDGFPLDTGRHTLVKLITKHLETSIHLESSHDHSAEYLQFELQFLIKLQLSCESRESIAMVSVARLIAFGPGGAMMVMARRHQALHHHVSSMLDD